MTDSKRAIGGSSGTPSLPRWLAKTHSRYDDDNISFSPPSDDGSTFFSLNVEPSEEVRPETAIHKSTFDRINEELGFAEIPDGRRVSTSRALQGRRGSGICITTELQQLQSEQIIDCSISTEDRAIKPLLLIPSPFSSPVPSTPAATVAATAAATTAAAAAASPSSSVISAVASSELIEKKDLDVTTASDGHENAGKNEKEEKKTSNKNDLVVAGESEDSNKKENQDRQAVEKQKQLGLFDRVLRNFVLKTDLKKPRDLPQSPLANEVESFVKEDHESSSKGEYCSSGGVVMERKMPVNSFFYRPHSAPESRKGSVDDMTIAETANMQVSRARRDGNVVAPPPAAVAAAAAAAVAAAQQYTGTVANDSLAAAAKPRRPKPSRLREMNFWAPTSM